MSAWPTEGDLTCLPTSWVSRFERYSASSEGAPRTPRTSGVQETSNIISGRRPIVNSTASGCIFAFFQTRRISRRSIRWSLGRRAPSRPSTMTTMARLSFRCFSTVTRRLPDRELFGSVSAFRVCRATAPEVRSISSSTIRSASRRAAVRTLLPLPIRCRQRRPGADFPRQWR